VARVRQGMKAMLRYGSAWFDVESQVKAITEKKLDSRRFLLCTDDSHAGTLTGEGHMDRVLRHAVECGLPPMTAIQMMTINAAEHFGLSKELGMIAPGRWADVALAKDLKNFEADVVIAKGKVIAEGGKWKVNLPKSTYPAWVKNSVKLKRKLNAEDFKLKVESRKLEVKANVIGVIENHAGTRHLTFDLQPENGEIKADVVRDLAKIAVVERHKATGKIAMGLVSGFGFTAKCAVASTVAHDSHHMIVVGTDDEAMALAGNALAKCGGGQVVVLGDKIIGLVEMKIAGLMSVEKADVVARKAESILEGFKMCGCELNNPNMQLSLLALAVIPG
ncbi:MAG TPA: adenine deaminase C-terminal domain-containing protein, partial [Anaerolineales bacterium]|nr:adenine deaminase C-terminal domain-containing protein [Anaerolineales bacterium]